MGDGRRETRDGRWEMEDGRWETVDERQEMTDGRSETGDVVRGATRGGIPKVFNVGNSEDE